MNLFEQLGLIPELVEAVTKLGFEKPTEIQERAIPSLVEKPMDMIGLAQTGTGKTAAFGLPLLQNFEKQKLPFGLIMAPTRELCLQITKELQNFSKNMPRVKITAIYGGASVGPQRKELEQGTDIIVATPGRLLDMMRRGAAKLGDLKVVVLDEADEMLQMGFIDDIRTILSEASPEKNTWLFSATMPDAINRITKDFMSNPLMVQVGRRNEGSENVEHSYYLTNRDSRFNALRRLLDSAPNIYGIVFCNTKAETQRVADDLIKSGYTANALHGDLTQQQRDMVMKSFRTKLVRVLVATDVAARGIDVDEVTHVIHFGLPNDSEGYTHRSGRTGRAGKKGESWNIVTKKEATKIPLIQKKIGKTIQKKLFPTGTEICKNQIGAFAYRVASTSADVDVVKPFLEDLLPMFESMSKEDVVSYFLAEEFDSLFRHYENSSDLNVVTERVVRNEYRYSINLGEDHGFTWPSMKDFLRDAGNLQKYAIEGVDVFGAQSEFSIRADEEEKLVKGLEGATFEGTVLKLKKLKDGGSNRGKKKSFGGSNSRGGGFKKSGGSRNSSGGNRSYGGSKNEGGGNRERRSGGKSEGDSGKRRSADRRPTGTSQPGPRANSGGSKSNFRKKKR